MKEHAWIFKEKIKFLSIKMKNTYYCSNCYLEKDVTLDLDGKETEEYYYWTSGDILISNDSIGINMNCGEFMMKEIMG